MKFQYRYVDYGTNFELSDNCREPDNEYALPEQLHQNELALDVGGCCIGYADCNLPVIDHHFPREHQFPSASAAVLHLTSAIRERFRDAASRFDSFWLVAHREPDFDAFCAMYLARHALLSESEPADWVCYGLHPSQWSEVGRGEGGGTREIRPIDWFSPSTERMGATQRWQVLLAALSSRIDCGVRLQCPPHLALHSVLYAAIERGRPYRTRTDGAMEFFDHARAGIAERLRNPLYDSVLNEDIEFAPELALLSREPQAYARDLQRARKVIVSIPVVTRDGFSSFYQSVSTEPLLESDGSLRPIHLAAAQDCRQVDGVYVRDPESLLFKDWARQDTVNSSFGRGFTFTAIAYSQKKRDALKNQTDYYFSLDPERAEGAHLYPAWALLQAAEVAEIRKPENARVRTELERFEGESRDRHRILEKLACEGDVSALNDLQRHRPTICRPHFEHRAACFRPFFHDPWFDGMNYACTIVPTPNHGSLIGPPGFSSDLSDDPVASIVRRQLEHAIYDPPVRCIDYPASSSGLAAIEHNQEVFGREPIPTLCDGYFRFGVVHLRNVKDLSQGRLAEQIGQELWPLLNPGEDSAPLDFCDQHLIVTPHIVGVWSRRGVFIASRPEAEDHVRSLQKQFEHMAQLSRELDTALIAAHQKPPDSHGTSEGRGARAAVEDAERLMLRIADFERDLVQPGSLLLRRMFTAIGLAQALATVRDLHAATVERDQRFSTASGIDALNKAQEKLEWVEVLIVTLYATEMVHIVLGLLGAGETVSARIVLMIAGLFGVLAFYGLLRGGRIALRAIPISVALVVIALAVLTFLPPGWLGFLHSAPSKNVQSEVTEPQRHKGAEAHDTPNANLPRVLGTSQTPDKQSIPAIPDVSKKAK